MLRIPGPVRLAFAALALLAAWMALPARADIAAVNTIEANGCRTFALCSAEADTTAACDDGTSNIVADLSGRYTWCAYATRSTATAYACDLYTSDAGYSATKRQALTSSGASTQITQAQQMVCGSGVVVDVWAECTTITGGAVTLTLLSCPSGR